MSDQDKQKTPPSLRSRYLTFAFLISIILLTCTTLANLYIERAEKDNHDSHELYESIEESTFDLKDSLTVINTTATSMLVQPKSDYEEVLQTSMFNSLEQVKLLESKLTGTAIVLKQPVLHLKDLLVQLDTKIKFLIKNKKNPNWVYPLFPYINSELLTEHRNFIAAVETALSEYIEEETPVDDTFMQLQSLRNLWQKKIMEFRASMIRFSGLGTIELTVEESRIEEHDREISNILSDLQIKQDKDELELLTDASVDIMIESSNIWHEKWIIVRDLKNSISWRGDFDYLNTDIGPALDNIAISMQELGIKVHKWSSNQNQKLTSVTYLITSGFWMLLFLSLIFIFGVYLMIERFVIQPTIRISDALVNNNHEHHTLIEERSTQEISVLTNAFNSMNNLIHQRQSALEHQALHDALTGLPNRVLLNDRLQHAITSMKRAENTLAVLLIDLDRFKDINDTLGHHIGDQLLQHVSERLQEKVRQSDTVSRLGGDEFAIIVPDINSDEAIIFAHKIISAIRDVFTINKQNIHIGASIGIAMYPENGEDNHTLLRLADTAMYTAKYNNLGAVLYDVSQDKNTPDSLSLVSDLHSAIEHDKDLSIFYQPQIDTQTNEIKQVEALLRWEHPSKGFIKPCDIIKLAEHTGIIQELTTWIVGTALKEYMEHLYSKNIRLAINLSAWNLQDPHLSTSIKALLKINSIPSNMLTLEVTETSMMSDPVHAKTVMDELHAMGVNLAIDDYGTGFSSLSYLKLLPVNELKIDKSFILDMAHDENDAIIVKSTIELAHNLGYKIIAEGVENEETLNTLKSLQCDSIQGFHISKPLSMKKLLNWIQDRNSS